MTPPWPGISLPASLAPKRRLMPDSNRSPACATAEEHRRRSPMNDHDSRGKQLATASAAQSRAKGAADRARPGLIRADCRRKLRPADGAAGEIAGDVGGPYQREKKQDRDQPEIVIAAQNDGRGEQGAGIEQPARGPETPIRARKNADGERTENDDQHRRTRARGTELGDKHRQRQRRAAEEEHQAVAGAGYERVPFPPDCKRGEQPKQAEHPNPQQRKFFRAAKPRRSPAAPAPWRTGCAGSGRCCGRNSRAFWRDLRVPRPSRQDPVRAMRPPNRRSRRRYSAIAPSNVARSKSGQ